MAINDGKREVLLDKDCVVVQSGSVQCNTWCKAQCRIALSVSFAVLKI